MNNLYREKLEIILAALIKAAKETKNRKHYLKKAEKAFKIMQQIKGE